MNMSIQILVLTADIRIQPSSHCTPRSNAALDLISSSSIAPAAASAPSVLTVRPRLAPAAIGSWNQKATSTPGRTMSSMTAKTTINAEIITGTIGLALIAPAVAIAAETPHIEIPEARHADHSLDRLNNFLPVA